MSFQQKKNFKILFKKALRILRNKEDAKDIAQTACLKLFQKLEEGVEIKNPIGYVIKTAQNLAINRYKKIQKESVYRQKLRTSSKKENHSLVVQYVEEADLLDYALTCPLSNDIKKHLDLCLTSRQIEALQIYLRNIQYLSKPNFRQIGKELGVSGKRAWILVEEARNKILLTLFISDLLHGTINHRAVRALTKDWRENPLRTLMSKVSTFNLDDVVLTHIQAKASDFFHLGVTSLESMIEKNNKINPEEFFKGYTYLFIASLPCWRVNQKIISDFGEEYILKNPKIPWIMKQVAFRANNLAGSLEFQYLYKEHLLRMIENPSSLEAIQTAFYILHYFGEFSFKERINFVENALLDFPLESEIIPLKTVKETRANIQEEWYRSKLVLLETNFLRMFLCGLVTKSFPLLKKHSKSYHCIIQITRNLLKYSSDERVKKLAKWLLEYIES